MTALAAQAAYEQLPELISSGSQFVPTDFSLANTDIIEVSFKTARATASQLIFCNRASTETGSGAARSYSLFLVGATPRFFYDRTVKSNSGFVNGSAVSDNTDYVVKCTGGGTTCSWTVNGVRQNGRTKITSFTPGGPLAFFASYSTGGGDAENDYTYSGLDNYAAITFRYAKVWASDGTTLKHHLVPAKDTDATDAKLKYGLLDIAAPETQVFYPNKGSRQFFAAEDTPSTATIFVTPDGSGDRTGTNWSNALKGSHDGFHIDLWTAITAAGFLSGSPEVNVYFASGEYVVTNGLYLFSHTTPINLRGGYLAETDGSLAKGGTATTFKRTTYNVRHLNATMLSALHIEGIAFSGGNVVGAAQGGSLYLHSTATVITNCIFSSNRVIQSTSYNAGRGGAIYATGGSLTLLDCKFNSNSLSSTYAVERGGALCTLNTPLLIDGCTFSGNYATAAQRGGIGGAICISGKEATIRNSTFENNFARSNSNTGTGYASGGALAVRSATRFEMTDCRLTGNYALVSNADRAYGNISGCLFDDFNAADGVMTAVVARCVFDSRSVSTSSKSKTDILLDCGRLFMTNCLVMGARGGHEAMTHSVRVQRVATYKDLTDLASGNYELVVSTCSAELVNCTVADGKNFGVGAIGSDSELTLKNCISWGHSVSGVVNAASIEYSCIQEPHDGAGNFVADPHWTGAPYYHLLTKRAGGAITDGWFGGTYNSPKTEKNSPCLDVGAPGSAGLDLEPHPNGRHVNLGAYGGTPWATKTLSPPPTTFAVQ